MPGRDSATELADVVMSYLFEHPEAMDTVEGISQWWVRNCERRVNFPLLKAVLGRLLDEGLLEAEGEGENTRYRLRRRL